MDKNKKRIVIDFIGLICATGLFIISQDMNGVVGTVIFYGLFFTQLILAIDLLIRSLKYVRNIELNKLVVITIIASGFVIGSNIMAVIRAIIVLVFMLNI